MFPVVCCNWEYGYFIVMSNVCLIVTNISQSLVKPFCFLGCPPIMVVNCNTIESCFLLCAATGNTVISSSSPLLLGMSTNHGGELLFGKLRARV